MIILYFSIRIKHSLRCGQRGVVVCPFMELKVALRFYRTTSPIRSCSSASVILTL